MKTYIFLIGVTFLQFAIFTGLWYYYWLNPMFKCPCLKFQETFPIAKSSAMLININLFLLLMSRIKLWLRFVYVSKYIVETLHKYFVIGFIFWSLVHSVAHYINFIKIRNFSQFLDWGVGLTGNILIILITLLTIFSLFKSVKENYYSLYISLHYIITFCILTVSIIHGTFCTIKYTDINCPIPTTWMWLILPCLIILCETIYKYVFNTISIDKVVYHNNVLELQLPLPKSYCGKTIYINFISVNLFEWHPFTVNTWNHYSDTCSIHIKIRGDWTKKLYDKLQKDFTSVKLRVDGPYHCLQKDFLEYITTNNTLLVSSGIGITNFAYTLKQLSKNPNIIQSKISMIIIIKSSDELLWLLDTLILLRNYIDFIFYFTNVSNNQFPFRYSLGRPHFNNLFDYLILQTRFTHNTKINIYYSGLQGIIKSITQAQEKNNLFAYHH